MVNTLFRLGKEGEIAFWDSPKLEKIGSFTSHQKGVNSLSFTPSGDHLATASQDETINLWNIRVQTDDFGKLIHTLRAEIDCQGMIIQNAKLSPELTRLLLQNGAITKERGMRKYSFFQFSQRKKSLFGGFVFSEFKTMNHLLIS